MTRSIDIIETLPTDWDDHAAWERHFQHLLGRGGTDEMQWAGGLRFAPLLHAMEAASVWFPGVGLSEAPALLTRFGFDVYASDVSRTAIDFQRHASANVQQNATELDTQLYGLLPDIPLAPGTLHPLVHDFREPFPHTVDCIISIQAIQGLRGDSLKRAAEVHFHALRPGRVAFFDTFNIYGERRDALEDALRNAGFFLPFDTSNRWYRDTLRSTRIPHLVIQDRPHVLSQGAFAHPAEREHAQRTLDTFAAEYEARREREWEHTQHRWHDGSTRIAQVTYHTSGTP